MNRWLLIIFLLISPIVFAYQEVFTFDSPVKQKRFEQLTQELRCLVCQNESLADSSAGLAQDLRKEVYAQVKAGENDAAIKKYLVARYGQFILFRPAVNPLTYALWMLPFVFLALAGVIWWVIFRSREKI